MNPDYSFFRSVHDYRGFLDEYGDVRQWRIDLRKKLYEERGKRSDLTQRPLIHSFDMHEGIFERRWVAKNQWQDILFAGVNCFLLPYNEHIPQPPPRTVCYWLSVANYGYENVERWIASLEFKVRPSTPWRGTKGVDVLGSIPDYRSVDKTWERWFEAIKKKVDIEA